MYLPFLMSFQVSVVFLLSYWFPPWLWFPFFCQCVLSKTGRKNRINHDIPNDSSGLFLGLIPGSTKASHGKPWKTYGKPMENLRKTMENLSMENLSFAVENLMENIWKTYGFPMEPPWNSSGFSKTTAAETRLRSRVRSTLAAWGCGPWGPCGPTWTCCRGGWWVIVNDSHKLMMMMITMIVIVKLSHS